MGWVDGGGVGACLLKPCDEVIIKKVFLSSQPQMVLMMWEVVLVVKGIYRIIEYSRLSLLSYRSSSEPHRLLH